MDKVITARDVLVKNLKKGEKKGLAIGISGVEYVIMAMEEYASLKAPQIDIAKLRERAGAIVDDWFHEYCEGRCDRDEMIDAICELIVFIK